MKVVAIVGKPKFVVNSKVQYRVETILSGSKTKWKQHYDTMEKAMAFIKREKDWREEVDPKGKMLAQYLVTEVTTNTLGLF